MDLFVENLDAIKRVARKIVKTWGNRFDVDELVNAAYIGFDRAVTNNPSLLNTQFNKVNILCSRAKLDMKDYIGVETGVKRKHKITLKYLSTIASDDWRNADFCSFDMIDTTCPFDEFENSDLLDALFDRVLLTDSEWSIIQGYFYEERTLKNISIELGLSEARVSNKKREILKKLNTCLCEMST